MFGRIGPLKTTVLWVNEQGFPTLVQTSVSNFSRDLGAVFQLFPANLVSMFQLFLANLVSMFQLFLANLVTLFQLFLANLVTGPDKKKFVSPTTFCRVEMCHQDSVIRDIKLGQKRA